MKIIPLTLKHFIILSITLVCIATAALSHARSVNTVLPKRVVMSIVTQEAQRFNVPVELALAVAKVESDFQTHAVSHAGARGVMQIMPKTGREEFGVAPEKLFDARTNVRVGVRFLRQLLDRYQRTDIALSHYNGGSAVNTLWGGLRVIPATRRYVDAVMAQSARYRHHPMVVADKDYPRQRTMPVSHAALDDFSGTVAVNTGRSVWPEEKPYWEDDTSALLPEKRARLIESLRILRQKITGYSGSYYPVTDDQRVEYNDRVALVRSWESYDQ